MGYQLLTTGIWNCCKMIFSIILPISVKKIENFPVFSEHLHRLNYTICPAIMDDGFSEQQWRGFTTYLAIDNSSFQNSLVFLPYSYGIPRLRIRSLLKDRWGFSDHSQDTSRILVLCEVVKWKHVLNSNECLMMKTNNIYREHQNCSRKVCRWFSWEIKKIHLYMCDLL